MTERSPMEKRYRALVGLRYPDGDEQYEKSQAGKPYEEVRVEAGDECVRIPAKSVEAYLSMGRDVIEEIADAKPAKKTKAGEAS